MVRARTKPDWFFPFPLYALYYFSTKFAPGVLHPPRFRGAP
jgi:hypothetical protein